MLAHQRHGESVRLLDERLCPLRSKVTSGTFASKVDYPASGGPVSVALADLNGDGTPDFAVANGGNATVSVLLEALDVVALVRGDRRPVQTHASRGRYPWPSTCAMLPA